MHVLFPSHLEQAGEKCSKTHWIPIYHEPERPPQGLVLKYSKVLKPGLVYIAFHMVEFTVLWKAVG